MTSGAAGRIPHVFDRCSEVAKQLALEIRNQLGREPDTGDALLALACVPDSLAGQALHEVGVDVVVLALTIERLRRHASDTRQELISRLEELRISEERAVEAHEFVTAANLRDEGRELARQSRGFASMHPGALQTVRRHLGISASNNVQSAPRAGPRHDTKGASGP